MSNPREVGLPPTADAPAFPATSAALAATRRRHSRRQQRRTVIAGSAVAAATALALSGVLTLSDGDTLIVEQPASLPPVQATLTPTHPVETSRPVVPGPTTSHLGAAPTPGTDLDQRAASAPSAPPAPPKPVGPPSSAAADATNSSAVTRTQTQRGQDSCRQPIEGWAAQGWCVTVSVPRVIQSGEDVLLRTSLCRSGAEPRQVRFAAAQQAAWAVHRDGQRLWSSAEQPSPFAAGEKVVLPPGRCLTWQVTWRGTSEGRPLPGGSYTMRLTTGADIRNAHGGAYHDQELFEVT